MNLRASSQGNKLLIKREEKSFNNITINNFFQKRIKFNSAFDHKGAKNFLVSKKAALENIVIDDFCNSSNNDSDTQSESNKIKKVTKIRHPKTFASKEKKHHFKSSQNLCFKIKNNLKKKKTNCSSTKMFNFKRELIKTYVTNENNLYKKLNKQFSSHEIKMFNDKEIRKIKPIKKTNKKYLGAKIDNKHKFFTHVEGEKSDDSSLFNIVSQL